MYHFDTKILYFVIITRDFIGTNIAIYINNDIDWRKKHEHKGKYIIYT